MAVRLILTIGSFFFLLILLSALFSRKTTINLSNKIYKLLIIATLLLIFTNIICFCMYCYTDYDTLSIILIRVHLLNQLFVYYMVYIYMNVVINKLEYNSIKELFIKDKNSKYICIFTAVYSLLFIFTPFKELSKTELSFLFPYSGNFIILYVIIIFSLTLIRLFKNKNSTKKSILVTFIMILIGTLTILMQVLLTRMSFICIAPTIFIFLLYFIVENPDIKLTKDLDVLKVQIENSRQSKSDFLSNMSHEIRSPMNAIIGFSDTSLYNETTFNKERVLNDAVHIKTSTKTLLDIINNILDVSKIESGGTETIDYKEYLLKDLIMNWNSIVEARLGDKPIKFSLTIDSNLPKKYYGDSTKVYQIVSNLITNAIKYTEVGKINMTIAFEKLSNDTVKLIFRVQDTGFGIKDEDKDKLFEKFTRLDSATNNEIEGTGLGLVLCKKYADLMQGKLSFDSEYNVGSTFYLELPQRIIDPTPIGNINETLEQESKKELLDCSGLKILIVDDDKLSLKVTKRLLDSYKADIELMDDPEKCVYSFKEGIHYDLIIVDHFIPKINGIELLHIIKNLKGYYIPPIVMLTANAIDGAKEEYIKEGFDDYLSKPIDVNELDRIINKYLKK